MAREMSHSLPSNLEAARQIARFRAICEELHASLGGDGGSDGTTPDELCRQLIEIDGQLRGVVGTALDEHRQAVAASELEAHCDRRHQALLDLAARMQRAEERLELAVERGRATLKRARGGDDGEVRRAAVAPSTVVEYAERVCYSNAAPVGAVAFAGAAASGFYHGWGTPGPQQHMLAASRFAQRAQPPDDSDRQPAGRESRGAPAAAPREEGGGSARASAPPPQQPSQPSFVKAAPMPAAAGGGGFSFSLGGSDESDSDDFE